MFWLPTATDLFYPGHDGRLLVVEYKGKHLVDNEDSREKRLVGEQWERSSGGRYLFLMATIDDHRPTLPRQLAAKIGG